MMGGKKGFEISRMLEEIGKLGIHQSSKYTPQEALVFAKMFSVSEDEEYSMPAILNMPDRKINFSYFERIFRITYVDCSGCSPLRGTSRLAL